MSRSHRLILLAGATLAVLAVVGLIPGDAESNRAEASAFSRGAASPQSISAMTFGPDGTLYLGDSKGGAIFAIETGGEAADATPVALADVEAVIAARLGTTADEVMVHDLAVHPLTHEVYLAVSRGRGNWKSAWQLPNHVADADVLLTVAPDGTLSEVPLDDVSFARVELPNPIDAAKMHPWMQEMSLRSDTITDLAVTENKLFVAGLSNEEFASTLWKVPLPLAGTATATTLEIYHGAHGEYETHAPIRTFVPYTLGGEEHILAAYLCTPFSLFKVADLKDDAHVRGRTIAEFGSGNYPLDMVVVPGDEGDRIFIANSNLPLIVVDVDDIATYEGEINAPLEEYSAGVEHLKRSGTGVQQMEMLGPDHLLMLVRRPSGTLDLGSQPLRRG